MTIQEIMNKLKDIKGNYINGEITSDTMIECLEDLIHDVQGNVLAVGKSSTPMNKNFDKEGMIKVKLTY